MSAIPRRQQPDVTRVLLADGWHEVERRTFELDGHSFGFAELVPVEGEHGELIATARFITGPLTSVLAVEIRADPYRERPPDRPRDLRRGRSRLTDNGPALPRPVGCLRRWSGAVLPYPSVLAKPALRDRAACRP